ncbi:hypothetical protein CONPUDRAFT_139675 [Coniophora puteana RWD-64-598 SS2]|uniref:Uncharacterized protein n=1 Tax=Coniophora puteana (strain RWD-64-598) TaxID=741705 RepID=A0A5M3MAL9_CONPW|nr:uncharacterized protein CONPUDRAFT_139675 [Coniophora puteana RWD-64-598 SS2]EIW76259.1 hypothetical protein CONPUDRAFT_139675 [Coniophora puteana RWD-64-598 SS2]
MPEYVYAMHDFVPEHEDEIAFRAGEPIEIIEKDDQYSDGWWQGRNLAGKVGLFPKDYTAPPPPPLPASVTSAQQAPVQPPPESTPAPPTTTNGLHTLREETEAGSMYHGSDAASRIGVALGDPVEEQRSQVGVMRATMTDVQKALEQLGQNRDRDTDGARSFSFASTRDGDTDPSDADDDTDHEGNSTWHRDHRSKLAENARLIVEQQQAQAAAEARSKAPPIEVEMSDESEAEEDEPFDHLSPIMQDRDHPHIPEEDEEEDERRSFSGLARLAGVSGSGESIAIAAPPADESQMPTVTAMQTTFPSPPPVITTPPVQDPPQPQEPSLPTPTSPIEPVRNAIAAPVPVAAAAAPAAIPLPLSPPEAAARVTPTPPAAAPVTPVANNNVLPSPSPSSLRTGTSPQQTSKHTSVASSTRNSESQPPATGTPATEVSTIVSADSGTRKARTPPSEWSVEDVVDWLKNKGFGQDICDKFIEQEITGDVLLELDINLLKAEVGIPALGKRMRIANAIAELRRPPSIVFPDDERSASGAQIISATPSSLSQPSSRPYSHSHHSSVQHSLNSPIYPTHMAAALAQQQQQQQQQQQGQQQSMSQPNSATFLSTDNESAYGRASSFSMSRPGGLGLGLVGVPGQLGPSPSESALQVGSTDEDRGAMSDGETATTAAKQRRRLFGRSMESTSSTNSKTKEKERDKDKDKDKEKERERDSSKDDAPSISPAPRPRKRQSLDDASISSRHRKKTSMDGNKGSERLSMFGHFSGSLGKGNRKPPPRVTSGLLEDGSPEKSSRSISRLVGGGGKKSSGRPTTSDGTSSRSNLLHSFTHPNQQSKERKEKTGSKSSEKDLLSVGGGGDRARPEVLRKRSGSPQSAGGPRSPGLAGNGNGNGASSVGGAANGGAGAVKPGRSILEQIGAPDHQGWLRKKGDSYNVWKTRYLVIKGTHLYVLRSNAKAETKIKGYINIVGYRVIADENIDPGRYGFRIVHDTDKTHFFSSEEQLVIREWMKSIMKATIGRDYSRPVVSSVNIPTIPLAVAQTMNPAPRPPSPSARAATQKALRRENPNQLSTRDARVLMGIGEGTPTPVDNVPSGRSRERVNSIFSQSEEAEPLTPMTAVTRKTSTRSNAPPRPSREMRRMSTTPSEQSSHTLSVNPGLIEWANAWLPQSLQVTDPSTQLYDGLALLRLAEAVVGKPSSPPVPDSAFPKGPNDDKLDGLFRLFDFLLDNDVKMGSVSINDVRSGKRDKVVQLLKALKVWEEKRREVLRSIGGGTVQAGPFMAAPVGMGVGAWRM